MTVLDYIIICFCFLLIKLNTTNYDKYCITKLVVLSGSAWLQVVDTLLAA